MNPYLVAADGRLPLPWLADPLARAAQWRGHALLMHGGTGLGLFELVMTAAQAQLCARPVQGAPCGTCDECRLVQAQSHPDLLVLLPEALREAVDWRVPEDPPERTRKSSQDILVDELREAIDWGSRSVARAARKVLVVHPAQSMGHVTANALLKTLEEPPGALRLLLTASNPADLLPTIASRCQHLLVRGPNSQSALAWLAEQGVRDAEVMLHAAGGEPMLASHMVSLGIDANAWRALPRAIASGHSAALTGWTLPMAVDALTKLCHDTMCLSAKAPTRFFPSDCLPGPAAWEALRVWSISLGEASAQSSHPLQVPLALDALVSRAARVWAKPEAVRAGATRQNLRH